ncbi:universal stress protein [Halobellus sp. Atlit-31R]|nr:universal stress protein [Halobellus sp. Atlit-31R]
MFEEVLFPTDGSEGAAQVLDHVLDLAVAHEATLHVLTAAGPGGDRLADDPNDVGAAIEAEAESIVTAAADRAAERGIETVTAVRRGDPSEAIVDYADETGVGLVVMPTHGRTGLERLVIGSTTERVVRRSTAPVLTVQPDAESDLAYPYERILVPTDGSECATTALSFGADLAATDGSRLDLLAVVDIAHLGLDVRVDLQIEQLESNAERFVDDGVVLATNAGVDEGDVAGHVETGTSIYRTIRSFVDDHDVDLVVMGTHGRTGLDRYLLGSVTEKILRTVSVPVLTVRERETE